MSNDSEVRVALAALVTEYRETATPAAEFTQERSLIERLEAILDSTTSGVACAHGYYPGDHHYEGGCQG